MELISQRRDRIIGTYLLTCHSFGGTLVIDKVRQFACAKKPKTTVIHCNTINLTCCDSNRIILRVRHGHTNISKSVNTPGEETGVLSKTIGNFRYALLYSDHPDVKSMN